MKKIKAMFFDVDGTIYAHRIHEFPSSTMKALKMLKENGYKVGISTSRCRYETKNLPSFFQTFPFDASCFDGGALVMEHDQIIHKTPIDQSVLHEFFELCRIEGMPVRYSTYDGDYFTAPCDADVRDNFFKLYLNMPIVKPYTTGEVFNMLVYPQSPRHLEMIRTYQDRLHLNEHGTKTMELTALHTNKSKGIETMAKHWQLSMEEIACFGDGFNDVQMLQCAGLGVAMGNAHETVKQAAHRVCDSVEQDGIYKFCREAGWI